MYKCVFQTNLLHFSDKKPLDLKIVQIWSAPSVGLTLSLLFLTVTYYYSNYNNISLYSYTSYTSTNTYDIV